MGKKTKAIVEIKDVSFNFGNNKVLENVSLSVIKGDFIGLIGPNGSGKTTLAKLMVGIYPLQSGSIKLFGHDIREFKEWSKIGYVPQHATNIDYRFPATVFEIVALGILSNKKFPKKITEDDVKKIESVLKTVGMAEYKNARISELSGGQQQRVFIARAIVLQPEILVLDEPTTGIDTASQEKFYELLGSLNKKGITIILISHDIGKITKYVNKIASLNKKLIFYGSHKEFCVFAPENCSKEHLIYLPRG